VANAATFFPNVLKLQFVDIFSSGWLKVPLSALTVLKLVSGSLSPKKTHLYLFLLNVRDYCGTKINLDLSDEVLVKLLCRDI